MNIEKYIEKLKYPIIHKINETSDINKIQIDMIKEIQRTHTREILIILNTLKNCTIEDINNVIDTIADAEITKYNNL